MPDTPTQPQPPRKAPWGADKGRMRILGDITSPIDVEWEAEVNPDRVLNPELPAAPVTQRDGGVYDTTRHIKASEFKAKCLKLMDEVAETGREIVITKRGKPVAKLTPLQPPRRAPWGKGKDQIRILGDISGPAVDDDEIEAWSNPDRVLNPEIPPLR